MSLVFSPTAAETDVAIGPLDQAPAAPILTRQATYRDGVYSFGITLVPTDHDGTPLTPNPETPGSTGLDGYMTFGAFNNADGSNPMDGLVGQQLLDAGLVQHQAPTSAGAADGTEVDVSFAKASPPGGGVFKTRTYTYDGSF